MFSGHPPSRQMRRKQMLGTNGERGVQGRKPWKKIRRGKEAQDRKWKIFAARGGLLLEWAIARDNSKLKDKIRTRVLSTMKKSGKIPDKFVKLVDQRILKHGLRLFRESKKRDPTGRELTDMQIEAMAGLRPGTLLEDIRRIANKAKRKSYSK